MLAAHPALSYRQAPDRVGASGERLQLAAQAAAPADDKDVHAELGAAVMLRLDEQRAVGIVGGDGPARLHEVIPRGELAGSKGVAVKAPHRDSGRQRRGTRSP